MKVTPLPVTTGEIHLSCVFLVEISYYRAVNANTRGYSKRMNALIFISTNEGHLREQKSSVVFNMLEQRFLHEVYPR